MDLKRVLFEANRYTQEIQAIFIKEYKKILDENDMSTKQSVVLSMLDMKGKLTMNEVAEIIGATPSAASQFIKKLESMQYVKRDVNKENRREVFVTLDKLGEKFFREIAELDDRIFDKYFMHLPEEDILTYHSILKKLHEIVLKKDS
ncbi:MarR family winged helix-turn-helix transcriptional regulator [Bacillus sp. EB01]|uniref:MarR family winged helix-turn-helix transcriptional regulator n=1 Tax=Bacillus sp. EB01 TaxID=1347086 RepID=UPI0005C6FFC3|nr:MarR family transcriptional regulator [Bacillus sp. EB01]